MTRKMTAFVLGLMLAGMPLSRAAADVSAALSGIPADAAGFICLPSLKQLDADIQEGITNLGLDAMVAPPMNSIVTMMKMNLPMLAGIDESKPVAFVVMPIETIQDIDAKSALVLSSADPKALLEGMGGTAGEGGIWSVNFMGEPQVAAVKGQSVVMGKTPEVVKAIAESKSSIATKMPKSDLAGLEDLDLVIWVDGPKLFLPLKPMLNVILMTSMMQLQAQGADPAAADQVRKGFEELVDGMGSLMLGLSVQNEGLGVRMTMTAKPGTEFAKKFNAATTKDSLLKGLPNAHYMIAGGMVLTEAQAKMVADEVTKAAGIDPAVEGVDAEKYKELLGLIGDMASIFRGVRLSANGLEPGPSGLVALSMVVDTTDAKRMIELKKKAVALGKDMIKSALVASDEMDEADAIKLLDAITFKTAADRIGGAEVTEFRFDLDKVADLLKLDEDEIAEIKSIIGSEGLLVRGAPINDHTIVTGFGGGAARFKALVDQARSDAAPLDADKGIQSVASRLPKQRAFSIFIAVDEILKTIQNVQRAVDEEPLPVQLPKLDAPVALNSTGGDGWSRFDIFVPTQLIRAITDASMAAAAAPAAGPATGEPGDEP